MRGANWRCRWAARKVDAVMTYGAAATPLPRLLSRPSAIAIGPWEVKAFVRL